MLLGEIRISADAIRDALERGGWCEDYTQAVYYYLRHRTHVTLRAALEDFTNDEWYNEPDEIECRHCGSLYTPEAERESNPNVTCAEIVRLFTDIGDQHMIDFFTAINDLGWEIPLDMKIDAESVEDQDWYYKEPKPARVPAPGEFAPGRRYNITTDRWDDPEPDPAIDDALARLRENEAPEAPLIQPFRSVTP
jgi:hypothetical protein